MGFKDNLLKNKDGKFTLKSKTDKKNKSVCVECGQDSKTQKLLHRYNSEDYLLVREYIEDHLTSYSNHKTMKPIWCEECAALIEYKVTLNASN
jgi:hypothetical protein